MIHVTKRRRVQFLADYIHRIDDDGRRKETPSRVPFFFFLIFCSSYAALSAESECKRRRVAEENTGGSGAFMVRSFPTANNAWTSM